MIDSVSGAPDSYEQLYESYFPMIKAIVAKAGIVPNMVEDVAMDILTKFMEKDALSWYDQDKLFDVGERPRFPGAKQRPARFASFLRRFVSLYVRQALDTQAVNDRKRASAPPQADDSSAETLIEQQANVSDDPTTGLDIMSTISTLLDETFTGATCKDCTHDSCCQIRRSELTTWKVRRRSELAYQRSRQALKAAVLLADAGERVSGASVARILDWPVSVGVAALREARDELIFALHEQPQAV